MRVAVRLTPRAGADRLLGVVVDDSGTPVLRAQVTAPPEDGKANAALIALLARRWHVAKSAVTLLQGASGRRKLVQVAGDPAELSRRIAESLDG